MSHGGTIGMSRADFNRLPYVEESGTTRVIPGNYYRNRTYDRVVASGEYVEMIGLRWTTFEVRFFDDPPLTEINQEPSP